MREMEERRSLRSVNHSVLLENRQRVVIQGVEDVDSFDEESVILVTDMGYMSIQGMDLHINKLNLEEGQLIIEGNILGLQYSDRDLTREKGGLFGKLLR